MNKIETPSGTVFKINEPEISGSLPIRNEVQVQPAGQQKGWVCCIDNSEIEKKQAIAETKDSLNNFHFDYEHGIWRSEPILINKKLLRNTCARNKIP